MRGQHHLRHLVRQANTLQQRQHHAELHAALTCWANHTRAQKQARQRAKLAQHGLGQFKLQRMLLAWYYCTHNAKLEQVHRQLAASQSLNGHLKQEARDAEKALVELQHERAALHRRLERVADHAKLQVHLYWILIKSDHSPMSNRRAQWHRQPFMHVQQTACLVASLALAFSTCHFLSRQRVIDCCFEDV